jgi:hypothetical protein
MYSKLVGVRRHIPSNRKFLAMMMAALVVVQASRLHFSEQARRLHHKRLTGCRA